MDVKEQIEKFRELIETNYLTKLRESINIGKTSLVIDFNDIAVFDHELADALLENPDELVKSAEISIGDLELQEAKIRIRITNIPKSQNLKIRNIRSTHLNKLYSFEGIVRQSSDVRPQVESARFECPSCGNVISILQLDTRFKEPYRCSCGRKGKFRMLDKALVDAQRLVIEESPETLEGGEQPKRIAVFLKEDLVEPKMEKRTTPGSKIRVIGTVREITIPLKTGAYSTRYDLSIDANYIEPIEQTFEEFELTKDEEKQIKELSKNPEIYDMFTRSIAPSIYGHEDIKEALMLQLMGGIRKEKSDGTIIRGDFHVLLCGDPGSAKSTLLMFMSKASPKSRYLSGKGSSAAGLCVAPNSLITTNKGKIKIKDFVETKLKNNMKSYNKSIWVAENPKSNKKIFTLDKNLKIKLKEINQFWKIKTPKYMVRITTSSGKEIITTQNTKLLSINKSAPIWKKANSIKKYDLIAACKDFKKLNILANSDIIWENVVKKEVIHNHGYPFVYDLTVEDSHNFIVNGLVVHNTASVVKDEFLRGWALEAGALVLANGGFAYLDEMDKMSEEESSALHEALEQQSYHPEFEIMFADGSIKKIGNFIDELIEKNKKDVIKGHNCEILKVNDIKLLTTDFNKIFPTNANSVSRHIAPNNFIEIVYSNGRIIKVTPEHPVFVFKDGSTQELPASELKKDMLTPIPRKYALGSKQIKLEPGQLNNYNNNLISDMVYSGIRFIPIKKISSVPNNGEKWVYDINVEPTHNFISEGLILHNSVTISKANIQAKLKAQTTVLAAANPKLGRFDPYKPIAEQINMPPALINRFDLIFPVKDVPNKELDEKIAKHVLDFQQNVRAKEGEISKDMIKRYVSYARQKVFPKISDSAIEEIKNFYVSLRNSGGADKDAARPIPINARQLEALVRLSEASARVRLSDKVTKHDAKRAIRVLRYCLVQVGIDPETGQIDIDRISTGITSSQRSRIGIIKDIIDGLEKERGKSIAIDDILSYAAEKGINESQIEEIIERLKRDGEIFEPKRGFISKL